MHEEANVVRYHIFRRVSSSHILVIFLIFFELNVYLETIQSSSRIMNSIIISFYHQHLNNRDKIHGGTQVVFRT